jgi:hypothetical protein
MKVPHFKTGMNRSLRTFFVLIVIGYEYDSNCSFPLSNGFGIGKSMNNVVCGFLSAPQMSDVNSNRCGEPMNRLIENLAL